MSGEKPILASDWDDVKYAFLRNYLRSYNSLNGTNFEPHNVTDYDLSILLGRSDQEVMQTVYDFHEHYESIEDGLMPSVQEVVPILAQTHNIVVITTRNKRYEHRIQSMIDRYLPGSISAVYHREDYEHYGSKGAFVRKLGVVALVDDHMKHVFSAVDNGVRGLLWNTTSNYHHPLSVERVNDWYDVYEKLTGQPLAAYQRAVRIGAKVTDLAS
jgi:hypothetical protein